ncbi:MAG: DUF6457 domain-containing protein [Nocardioidaceae bacterium]
MTLQDWMDELSDELSVDTEVDMSAILDLARDAAKGVARPAAPLTTFLVGYAAAMRGGTLKDISECTDTATDLASEWAART